MKHCGDLWLFLRRRHQISSSVTHSVVSDNRGLGSGIQEVPPNQFSYIFQLNSRALTKSEVTLGQFHKFACYQYSLRFFNSMLNLDIEESVFVAV